MKKTQKALSVFLSLLITVSAFSASPIKTRAASPMGVYGGISPSVITSVIDDMEESFEGESLLWTASVGSCSAVTEMTSAPYSPYEGNASLLWDAGYVSANSKVKLVKGIETLTDTSYYKFIAATFFIPSEAEGASVTMKLYGTRGTITDTKVIDAGKWQTVFFDTKELKEGKALRIEFIFETERACDLYVLADCIGGCWSSFDLRAARYMTQGFEPFGCTVEYDRSLTVSLSGEGQYLEAKTAVNAELGDGIGLRINMINHTSCRSLTFRYKTEDSVDYDKEMTLDIPDSDREITLLFKIPEERIKAFILCFNGAPTGDIEILSIGPSPCFEASASLGTITECRIARDLKNISVKGSLSPMDETWDGKIMLYALSPNEDNSSIALLREPLAEVRAQNGEFSFAVPLDRDGDGIFKKYIVAAEINGALTVLCEPGYINNPELLATERTSLPESKKGIRPLPDNYVLYGISQTAVDIDLVRLISTADNDAVSHTVGSITHLFSKEYLASLDDMMEEYSREGVKVHFVYKLVSGGTVIAHPDSTGGSAALNTKTAEGINALRAVTDLLVRRYGSSEGKTDNLVGIVLGASVNDSYNNYNLGAVTLNELTRELSIALRTVYNASLSVTSGFEISIPIGGVWSGENTVGQKGSFDARSLLEAISDCITAGGDINWKLAYDITPDKGEYAFETLLPDLGVGAERITAANLEVLTDYFSIQPFLYNGASRGILLLGDGVRSASSVSEERSLTADYIYTFLRISGRSMKNISGYIPSHEADYSEALKYLGTDIFASKSDFASALIGKDRFEALMLGSTASDRSYTESRAGNVLPDGIKGESVIYNLKKKNAPIPSLNCISAESGVSYGDRSDWGRISFGKAGNEALRGFVLSSGYPLDLSVAPYISFDLIVSSLPEGVDTVKVTVALYSKNNIAVASTSVPVGGIQPVVCDMTDFSHLSSCDRIGIYITGESGEDIGEPMILVSSVKAHSKTLSDKDLKDAINVLAGESDTVSVYKVINLMIVAVCSIAVLVLRLVLRNKRSDKSSDDNQ